MDGNIEGPWTEAHIQTLSQQNDVNEEEKKAKQKSRRKWWKMSRNDIEEKANALLKKEGTCFKSPSPNDTRGGSDVNVMNSLKTVKGANESMDFSLKFSVNKKPSLDPLDLNDIKKHEKKKKRKDQKNKNAESAVINKKTCKSKSASVQSPRLQNNFQRSEQARESPVSPTDSEFWSFDKTRSPLNFNVEQPLDIGLMADRSVDKDPSFSDEEYEAEMAYRFPILYKRLAKQSPLPTGSCDPERHIATPKPPRKTPDIRADVVNNPFKMKSSDAVLSNRRDAYIVPDTFRNTLSQSCAAGSNADKDKSTTSVNLSIADTVKPPVTISFRNDKGSSNCIGSKGTNMVLNSHCDKQGTNEQRNEGRLLIHNDVLAADIDKLLEELDDIW